MKLEEFNFGLYLCMFEQKVIVPLLKDCPTQTLSIRDNKLSGHELRNLIGTRFKWEEVGIISFYDVEKRSLGFMKEAIGLTKYTNRIQGKKISFASIKVEDIFRLAPELLECFPKFKAILIEKRFGKNEGTQ